MLQPCKCTKKGSNVPWCGGLFCDRSRMGVGRGKGEGWDAGVACGMGYCACWDVLDACGKGYCARCDVLGACGKALAAASVSAWGACHRA